MTHACCAVAWCVACVVLSACSDRTRSASHGDAAGSSSWGDATTTDASVVDASPRGGAGIDAARLDAAAGASDAAASDARDGTTPDASVPTCPAVANPFGVGLRLEGQCAPTQYSGDGVVALIETTVMDRTDYYVELSAAASVAECSHPPRLWISAGAAAPKLALAMGQRIRVDYQTEIELEARVSYSYATLTQRESGALLFVHHDYDDRFFELGRLAVGNTFEFALGDACRFESPCYVDATRVRFKDLKHGIDLGEFESSVVQVAGRSYGLYVTNSRRSEGWRQSECPGAHYKPGYRVVFDIVAQ